MPTLRAAGPSGLKPSNLEVDKAKRRFGTEMAKAMKRAGIQANKGITASVRKIRSS